MKRKDGTTHFEQCSCFYVNQPYRFATIYADLVGSIPSKRTCRHRINSWDAPLNASNRNWLFFRSPGWSPIRAIGTDLPKQLELIIVKLENLSASQRPLERMERLRHLHASREKNMVHHLLAKPSPWIAVQITPVMWFAGPDEKTDFVVFSSSISYIKFHKDSSTYM